MDMLYDFHTHTTLSDGVLTPLELIRRAVVSGYAGIAVTDHVGRGSMPRIITELKADCRLAQAHWGIRVLLGVELTHVPPDAIADLAKEARALGAEIVVVHGESPVEPVAPGTNHAALTCREVDILAHPGFLSGAEAELAAANDIFLEITARGGHNRTNALVVQLGRSAGARFLIDSDAHDPADLLTSEKARLVALGAGISMNELDDCLIQAPRSLIERIEGAGRPKN